MKKYNRLLLSLWIFLSFNSIGLAAKLVELRTLGGPGHADLYPSGIEATANGNWVIADTGNNRVLKVTPNGDELWSIGKSGSGIGEFSEPRDIGIAANGNIYVSDSLNKRIVMLDSDGNWIKSWRGPESNILVNNLMGIAIDGEKLYLAEPGKQRVRIWNTELTQQLLVIESQGICQFGGVRDVDVDANGNIYAGSFPPQKLFKFSSSGQCLRSWEIPSYSIRIAFDPVLNQELMYVGRGNGTPGIKAYDLNGGFIGGMATPGLWDEPGTLTGLRFLTVAPNGDVLAGDLHGYAIERYKRTMTGWNHAQQLPDPIKAPPQTDAAVFNQVRDVAFDANGKVYAMDYFNNHLVVMEADGKIDKICGTRKTMGWPNGVAVDQTSGDIWYTAVVQRKIRILRQDCSQSHQLSANSVGVPNFSPRAVAIRGSDRITFVADSPNSRIILLNMDTRKSIATFGTQGTGVNQFKAPQGIAIDPISGHVWVADTKNHRVVELAVSGTSISWLRSITNNFLNPKGVAVDSEGQIYVADTDNNRVVAMDSAGNILDVVNGLNSPSGVAVNAMDEIHVSDTYNDVIRVFKMDTPVTNLELCGSPFYDRRIDSGLYLWQRDGCSDSVSTFSVRAVAGGASGALTYSGMISTDLAFRDVLRKNLESSDLLAVSNDSLQIDYRMRLISPYQDGFDFKAPNAADVCFGVNLPQGMQLRVGPDAIPVEIPFNLKTFAGC